jgi:hypothetical protein
VVSFLNDVYLAIEFQDTSCSFLWRRYEDGRNTLLLDDGASMAGWSYLVSTSRSTHGATGVSLINMKWNRHN